MSLRCNGMHDIKRKGKYYRCSIVCNGNNLMHINLEEYTIIEYLTRKSLTKLDQVPKLEKVVMVNARTNIDKNAQSA